MTAEVCGSRSSRLNVAPPLKSERTKFRVSESWVQASASRARQPGSVVRPCRVAP